MRAQTRRGVLGYLAATAATVSPKPALAALGGVLDSSKAAPAIRAAVQALHESSELLKVAVLANDAAMAKAEQWQVDNPKPTSRRGIRRWWKKYHEIHYEITEDSWLARMEAEEAFKAAQMTVAKTTPRDLTDLALMTAAAIVFDDVELASINRAPISRVVAFHSSRLRPEMQPCA